MHDFITIFSNIQTFALAKSVGSSFNMKNVQHTVEPKQVISEFIDEDD